MNNTALLTDQGDVLVCGRGRDGQLGQGEGNILVATLLPKSPGLAVKQVVFAMNYTLNVVTPRIRYISLTSQPPCSATIEDVKARECMTDMERSVMRSLECPVCLKVMCPPIHQCLKGHSLCNTCRTHPSTTVCPLCKEIFGEVRNLALESLTSDIQLPCSECLLRLPACELERHSSVCPNREYSCPLERTCVWSGRPDKMLAHTSSAHPDQTWRDQGRDLPHLFLHSTSDDLVHTNVLAAHNQVFTLHRKFNQATCEFQAIVRFIGSPEDKDKFQFEFTFLSDNNDKLIILKKYLCRH